MASRSMIVMDTRRTETADLADFFLQVKPGTDVYCLAAMVAILFEEDLVDHAFIRDHVIGADEVDEVFRNIPVTEFADRCGVVEDLIRSATRRIGTRIVGGNLRRPRCADGLLTARSTHGSRSSSGA